MNGTLPGSGYTLAWTLVGIPADPLRVVVAFSVDDHPCGYGLGRLDGDVFTPWCGCEHGSPTAAADCPRSKAARAAWDAARASERIAALVAPAGARFLRHCNTYWRAAAGGACATCGALGDVFLPRISVADERSHGWTRLTTVGVTVFGALEDAGLAPTDVRHAHGDIAFVTGLRAAEIGAALTAAGWDCAVKAYQARAAKPAKQEARS